MRFVCRDLVINTARYPSDDNEDDDKDDDDAANDAADDDADDADGGGGGGKDDDDVFTDAFSSIRSQHLTNLLRVVVVLLDQAQTVTTHEHFRRAANVAFKFLRVLMNPRQRDRGRRRGRRGRRRGRRQRRVGGGGRGERGAGQQEGADGSTITGEEVNNYRVCVGCCAAPSGHPCQSTVHTPPRAAAAAATAGAAAAAAAAADDDDDDADGDPRSSLPLHIRDPLQLYRSLGNVLSAVQLHTGHRCVRA